MAEITFRVPSRTVQYGYVELPVTIEGDPSPENLAAMYVSYVHAFQKEEEATVKRLLEALSAPLPASEEDVVEEAKAALDEGLGGVTEVPDDAAPWDKPAVDSKAKPWETGSEAPAKPVVSEDW